MDTDVFTKDVREGKPSASGMQRIALCPGSWWAEQSYPEQTSEAAEQGTRLHKHMEEGTLPADPVEAEACEWCREQEVKLALEYADTDTATYRELRWWDKARSFSGQADVVFVNQGIALVLDYKFGRVPVPVATNNMQLAALALLVFDNVPGTEVVFCGILQPFASRQEPRVVRYRAEQAETLRSYLSDMLTTASVPTAPRVPGEEQCRYCKARLECHMCYGLVKQHTAVAVAPLWADWSAEQKAQAVRVAALAKKWADAVERKAKEDLKQGLTLPGITLGAGRKSFKVADPTGAFTQLNALLELSGEEFASCCSVRISDLDKVVHAKLSEHVPEGCKQTVKASATWLRAILADYGSVSESEGSLKIES